MRINKRIESKQMKNYSLFIFTFSLIIMSTSLWAELSRDSSGVVADSTTGLAWQDAYSDSGDTIKRATWQDALVYCEELSLGEKSDWRLPNKNELFSIVDMSKYDSAISSVFTNVTSNVYWSSTSNASDSSSAWIVGFGNGAVLWYSKTSEDSVRCVRGGQ